MESVHIGRIIEQEVRKSMSISEFAAHLNCERSVVYAIFKRKSIDIERLMQISNILDFDFIHTYYLPKKTPVIIEIKLEEDVLKDAALMLALTKLIKKTTKLD
jgi:hypothetical protein